MGVLLHCVVGNQDATGNPSLGHRKQLEGIRHHRLLLSDGYYIHVAVIYWLIFYELELQVGEPQYNYLTYLKGLFY